MNFSPTAGVLSAPEKGSFPLDHEGECRSNMRAYLSCMAESRTRSRACREAAALYLQCRMDRGLMKPESLEDLGFRPAVPGQGKSST